jgi:hypothetical protein
LENQHKIPYITGPRVSAGHSSDLEDYVLFVFVLYFPFFLMYKKILSTNLISLPIFLTFVLPGLLSDTWERQQ